MKTRFSRRHRALTPSVTIALIVSGTLVVLVVLLRFFFPSVLTTLATPLYAIGTYVTATVSGWHTSAATISEYETLKAEVTALQNENRTLRAAVQDLGRLGDDLAGVRAGVLARPPLAPYDVLVVDRGTRDGVAVGSLARGAGGVPIGTVIDVAPSSARIALYSAPGQETPGWVGDARVALSLSGEGSGAFTAEVSRDSGVVEGDLVYVAGGGAHALGVVVRVVGEASSPSSTLFIRPFVNPFTTTWVSLTTPVL